MCPPSPRGARTAGLNPVTDRAALFLRALGARQLRCRPDRPRADALMLLQLCVRLPDDRVSMRIGLENEHCVRSSAPSTAPTTADSRTPACTSSARSTSSGKTFSPSGLTIISFLRPLMNRRPCASRSPMSPVCSQPSASRPGLGGRDRDRDPEFRGSGLGTDRIPGPGSRIPSRPNTLVTFSPRTRISPSSAMRTSTPSIGVPTDPLLVLNG